MTASTITPTPTTASNQQAPIRVGAAAMAVGVVAIVWQIIAGVDYPTIPPGPIMLAVATVIVLSSRRTWARVVGVVVPLFLTIGGTIASIRNDGNALRSPDDLSTFIPSVLLMVAMVVALVAGVVALRRRSS